MAVRAQSPMAAAAKMEPAMDTYRGAFNAIGRLLNVCASGRPTHPVWEVKTTEGFEGMLARKLADIPPVAPLMTLADLADGPYYVIAAQLGAADLRNVDAVCRLTRDLNRVNGGPWCNLGRQAFIGMELDGTGIFEPEDDEDVAVCPGTLACRRLQYIDWKGRYQRFLDGVIHFRSPFTGAEITAVDQADEIAYCRCKLRTDLLDASSGHGVYLEVEVRKNPDNVSLAVVDFEAGGCSSVTFSPDTGAVIRERKIRESPRKVEGTYIQPLTTITSGQGFEGFMGLYLKGGHLAFFRRHAVLPESGDGEADAAGKEPELGPWECTGFVTDLSWSEGKRLTPCLAFRDVGTYQVCMTRVDAGPPIVPQRSTLAYEESNWRSLDWDAGEQEALEV